MQDNIFAKENIATLTDAKFIFELYTQQSSETRDKLIEASNEKDIGVFVTSCIRMHSLDDTIFDLEILKDISRRYLRIFRGT